MSQREKRLSAPASMKDRDRSFSHSSGCRCLRGSTGPGRRLITTLRLSDCPGVAIRSSLWRAADDEPRYGSDLRERCIGLNREARDLRIRLDREWNPVERVRTEGRLRGVQDQEARAGCR